MTAESNENPSAVSLPQRRRVLQAAVDAISPHQAADCVLAWAARRESRTVVFANVHVVAEAGRDPGYAAVLEQADLVTPDGWPVAWLMRRLYRDEQERVSGPDLMWDVLAGCAAQGTPVYLFGSTAATLQRLQARIAAAFPALRIAGVESPPFRTMTGAEQAATRERIARSGAGVVFVGLGCPRQERWIAAQRGQVPAVMLGVGAAFDFHAGTVRRAPRWMRDCGLEWLHRLAAEPARLWRRYLVANTAFILGALSQFVSRALPRG